MVFFHSDYDTVYLSTRFTGRVEPEGTGSRISGTIGKMGIAIFFLYFMVAAMGIGGIVMLSQHLWQQALLLFCPCCYHGTCVMITPQASVTRLEKLLNLISTLPAETLQEEDSKEDNGGTSSKAADTSDDPQ